MEKEKGEISFEFHPEDKTLDFILEKSREISSRIINLRNELHENPELGGEEIETTKRIRRELEKLGAEIMGEIVPVIKDGREIGKTGLIAKIKGSKEGPTIALRADIDALPIQEDRDNPHCSRKEGIMHACGHDVHTAALIGAAEILSSLAREGKLEGNVVLIFQPSEERTVDKQSGAVKVIRFLERKGLRKEIDAIFGLHVAAGLERGTIRLKEGPQNASSGDFEVVMKAPGGHIMESYKLPNINSLLAKIIARLNKEFEPQRPEEKPRDILVSSASTHFVGKVGYNILAREGGAQWVLRILHADYKEKRKEILEKIKEAVSKETEPWLKSGLEVEFKFNPGYRPLIHRHPEILKIARKSAQDVIGSSFKLNEQASLGGEDFSFYLEEFRGKEIPGAFLMVGGANPEKGIPFSSHHHPKFKIDEEVIPEMAAIYARLVTETIRYLKNKEK